MFRKFIEKYYNFILWTKKWHFFHLLFVIPTIGGFVGICMGMHAIFFEDYIHSYPDFLEEIPGLPLGIIFITCIMFFLAFIFEIFILIKRAIAHKPLCVLSSFLKSNDKYHKFYVFSACLILNIIPLTYIFLFSLLIIGDILKLCQHNF